MSLATTISSPLSSSPLSAMFARQAVPACDRGRCVTAPVAPVTDRHLLSAVRVARSPFCACARLRPRRFRPRNWGRCFLSRRNAVSHCPTAGPAAACGLRASSPASLRCKDSRSMQKRGHLCGTKDRLSLNHYLSFYFSYGHVHVLCSLLLPPPPRNTGTFSSSSAVSTTRECCPAAFSCTALRVALGCPSAARPRPLLACSTVEIFRASTLSRLRLVGGRARRAVASR